MHDKRYLGDTSINHDNYFAEMVQEITSTFNAMREIYIKASVLDCLNKGEFDLLGGIEKYDYSTRIFGISYEGDVSQSQYPIGSINKNKDAFYKSVAHMSLIGADLKDNTAKLLNDFFKISNNRHPRDVVLIQQFHLPFTHFGGIVPKVHTSFENKLDYLGKELIGSTINSLEKLYLEE